MKNHSRKLQGNSYLKSVFAPFLIIGIALFGLGNFVSLISERYEFRNHTKERGPSKIVLVTPVMVFPEDDYSLEWEMESYPSQFPCKFTPACSDVESSCVHVNPVEGFCSSNPTEINFSS